MAPSDGARAPSPTQEPVRLKVSYKTAESLLGEFTRSIGKGRVTIESGREVPLGTRFVFELHAKGVPTPVEVLGEVIQVHPSGKGKFALGIRYDPSTDRKGLDAVLRRIFEAHKFEKVRKHPRIPIVLQATEHAPYSPAYRVRDISRGGLGIEVEAPVLPAAVRVGVTFLLELWLSLGTLALHGEVAWTMAPAADQRPWISPCFGVKFGKLRPDSVERLETILSLHGLPPPPWTARLSFGMDAVSRLP